MLKQIFFFFLKMKGKRKEKKISTLMTCCYEDTCQHRLEIQNGDIPGRGKIRHFGAQNVVLEFLTRFTSTNLFHENSPFCPTSVFLIAIHIFWGSRRLLSTGCPMKELTLFLFFLISSCFTLIQVCILGVLPTPQSPQGAEFPLSSAVDLGPLALHLREWRHELRIFSLWDLVSDPIS